jgi:hypothetical protein
MILSSIRFLTLVVLLAVSTLVMITGSVMDLRKRSVNPFLFLPVLAVGVAVNIFISSPTYFIVLSVIAFFFSFLNPSSIVYGAVAVALLLLGILATALYDPVYGFEFLVISIIYMTGFRQRLFGIGDTKAIISLVFAFTGVNVSLARGVLALNGLIANGLFILLDIVIASLFFLVFEYFYINSRYERFGASSFRIPYSPEAEAAAGNGFARRNAGEREYLAYRVPFLVPVAAGYLIFIIAGSWIL